MEDGIQKANSSEYGLTSGLQSLDESEQLRWKNSIEAGNLYINRGITGAIVNRQPFGGMKRSAFGGGIKAGGRNYVSCFVNIEEKEQRYSTNKTDSLFSKFAEQLSADEKERFLTAVESYKLNWENEFSKEEDIHNLMGEKNTFRYLPLKNMALRVMENDSLCDVFMVIAASNIAKTPLTISISYTDSKIAAIRNVIATKGSVTIETEVV